jgi:hypothetical protein
LAIELIKKQHKTTLLFEDEGSNIGALHIPNCVQAKTKQAKLILLEANIEQRLNKKSTQCLVTAFNTRIVNTRSRINPLLRDLTTQTTTKTIKCTIWVVFDEL